MKGKTSTSGMYTSLQAMFVLLCIRSEILYPYSWLTQTDAINALLGRLNNSAFWSASEAWVYLTEALRHWNGLTEQWNAQYFLENANGQWVNTGTQTGSPRLRTVTDQYLYNQMCSMLLEPQLNAGAWAGSSQFNLGNFQSALQKRTQEVIQAASTNLVVLPPIQSNLGPGTRFVTLPDTVLEPRRIRFMALMAQTIGNAPIGSTSVTLSSMTGIQAGYVLEGAGIQSGTFIIGIQANVATISQPTTATLSQTQVQAYFPITLTREDPISFQSFEPEYLQTVAFPKSWAIADEPPLGFYVDIAPTVPGYYEVLALVAGPTFSPPNASLLGVPDDWSMLPMYGALADVLGMEAESTDRARAAYCLERYTQMLEMVRDANWLLQTFLGGGVAYTTSLAQMDGLAIGWQESNSNLPSVVLAGTDMLAPVPGTSQLMSAMLVGNAPLLDTTGVYVQVSRDDFEAVLNYAQHIATFKMGNDRFQATMPMLKDFYRAAVAVNARWATYGIFVRLLRREGEKQGLTEPKELKNAMAG
ncbi:MAG: hypothetical protein ACP5EP_11420 [Acidobacteriaceae bacterium]